MPKFVTPANEMVAPPIAVLPLSGARACAAKIADPQPPSTSRKVPMNSAPSFLPRWMSSMVRSVHVRRPSSLPERYRPVADAAGTGAIGTLGGMCSDDIPAGLVGLPEPSTTALPAHGGGRRRRRGRRRRPDGLHDRHRPAPATRRTTSTARAAIVNSTYTGLSERNEGLTHPEAHRDDRRRCARRPDPGRAPPVLGRGHHRAVRRPHRRRRARPPVDAEGAGGARPGGGPGHVLHDGLQRPAAHGPGQADRRRRPRRRQPHLVAPGPGVRGPAVGPQGDHRLQADPRRGPRVATAPTSGRPGASCPARPCGSSPSRTTTRSCGRCPATTRPSGRPRTSPTTSSPGCDPAPSSTCTTPSAGACSCPRPTRSSTLLKAKRDIDVAALPMILERGMAAGLQFVTVSQLLAVGHRTRGPVAGAAATRRCPDRADHVPPTGTPT